MADSSATFSVDIEETGGDDAATSLEALRDKILADTGALREMQAAMRNMKGGTSINIEAFKELRDQIDAQKAAIAAAQSGYVNLGGTFSKTGDAAKDLENGLGDATDAKGAADLGGALKELPGPLGKAAREGSRLGSALKSLGGAGPYVAIAAAIALITVAAIAATVGAIGLADGLRNAALATAGIAASSPALAGLASIMPSIQSATGLATAEIQKLAEQLDAAGVKSKDMPAALRAMAEATAGGATSTFLQKLNADLKSGAKSVGDLAREVHAKFGGIVASKLLSLSAQSDKLSSNFKGLFAGIKIDGFLAALSTLVGLFDANTASGKAIKILFEAIFQPLIDGAAKAIPYVKAAFIQAEIYALKAYIALKKFANSPVGQALIVIAEIVGGVIVGALALATAAVGLFFAGIAALLALAAAPFIAIGVAIDLLVENWDAAGAAIVAGFSNVLDFLGGLPGRVVDIGASIISGLVGAITGGAGAVISAVTNLGSSALNALTSIFDSHSPSKAFGRIGDTGPQGVVGAFEDGESDVEAAAGGMGKAALRGTSKAMSGGAGGKVSGSGAAGGGVNFHFAAGAIVVGNGVEDPSLRAKVIALFEECVQMAGLSPSPEAA